MEINFTPMMDPTTAAPVVGDAALTAPTGAATGEGTMFASLLGEAVQAFDGLQATDLPSATDLQGDQGSIPEQMATSTGLLTALTDLLANAEQPHEQLQAADTLSVPIDNEPERIVAETDGDKSDSVQMSLMAMALGVANLQHQVAAPSSATAAHEISRTAETNLVLPATTTVTPALQTAEPAAAKLNQIAPQVSEPTQNVPYGEQPIIPVKPDTIPLSQTAPQQMAPRTTTTQTATMPTQITATQSDPPREIAPQNVPPTDQKIIKLESKTASVHQQIAVTVTEPSNVPIAPARDVVVEIALTEIAAPGTAEAESGQTASQNGQSQGQSNAPMHNPMHFDAQLGKDSASAAPAPTPAPALPISDDALIDQVREQVARLDATADGKQVRLQLHPAELGEIQITLRMDDQRLKVEIMAENKAVKNALLEHADTLKEVLSRQNITVDRFDVGTGTGNGFGQFFREGSRPDEQQRTSARFMQQSGFNQRQNISLPVTASWQPRSNALVDVRF